MTPQPSPGFIARTRNPSIIAVRPRESAKEIAARIREGVKIGPIVVTRWSEPNEEAAA